MSVRVAVDGRAVVGVPFAEIGELIELLWGVSATQGAVVAIGRLNYSLTQGVPAAVHLSEHEAIAVRAALERAEELPPGLSTLLESVSTYR